LVTNTDDLRVTWDSPNIKTWFTGSNKPQGLFKADRKTNCATALSNSMAGSFGVQTPLPDSGSVKSQTKRYSKVNPALYVL